MAKKIEYGRFLHGGDYNPEQWLDRPDILKKDIEYFKEAHINTVSVGIFSWAVLEPEEGKYNLDWLEQIIDNLYKEGIYTILATPSGARPKWMADKYPEVLRMDPDRTRRFFGGRHNHCYTSPVYREKIHAMDKLLSQRLGSHPGVLLWHISNEFGGECARCLGCTGGAGTGPGGQLSGVLPQLCLPATGLCGFHGPLPGHCHTGAGA